MICVDIIYHFLFNIAQTIEYKLRIVERFNDARRPVDRPPVGRNAIRRWTGGHRAGMDGIIWFDGRTSDGMKGGAVGQMFCLRSRSVTRVCARACTRAHVRACCVRACVRAHVRTRSATLGDDFASQCFSEFHYTSRAASPTLTPLDLTTRG